MARSYAKPGEARFVWGTHVNAPPELRADPIVDTTWRGTLSLNPGGHIGGELRDATGWVLDIRGTAQDARTLALRLFVERVGLLHVEADDRGVTADLTAAPSKSWALMLTRGDAGWAGRIEGNAWVLAVAGQQHGTGCLKLRAHVAAASQEGQP